MMTTVAAPARAKARFSLDYPHDGHLDLDRTFPQPSPISFSTLVHAPWPDLAVKLEALSWKQVVRTLGSLAVVASDAKRLARIGETLKNRRQIGSHDRLIFLDAVDRYALPTMTTCRYLLEKEKLSDREYHYLLLQYRAILKKETQAALRYVEIRKWLSTAAPRLVYFEPHELVTWRQRNTRLINLFQDLANIISSYEKTLD